MFLCIVSALYIMAGIIRIILEIANKCIWPSPDMMCEHNNSYGMTGLHTNSVFAHMIY